MATMTRRDDQQQANQFARKFSAHVYHRGTNFIIAKKLFYVRPEEKKTIHGKKFNNVNGKLSLFFRSPSLWRFVKLYQWGS